MPVGAKLKEVADAKNKVGEHLHRQRHGAAATASEDAHRSTASKLSHADRGAGLQRHPRHGALYARIFFGADAKRAAAAVGAEAKRERTAASNAREPERMTILEVRAPTVARARGMLGLLAVAYVGCAARRTDTTSARLRRTP